MRNTDKAQILSEIAEETDFEEESCKTESNNQKREPCQTDT